MNGQSTRRGSEAINADRRTSKTPPVFSRKTSESLGLTNGGSGPNSRRGSKQDLGRKPSSELNEDELSARRMSEAGLRRPSANSDEVLNEDTEMLMVGMPVWVDGTKHGRIAYIGEVHLRKETWPVCIWIQPVAKIMVQSVVLCIFNVNPREAYSQGSIGSL